MVYQHLMKLRRTFANSARASIKKGVVGKMGIKTPITARITNSHPSDMNKFFCIVFFMRCQLLHEVG